ncbi:hypothetical protein JOC77_000169 [Peribacillus deserti]|uniref:Phosphatase n=1 Tax=Peribacillus deserti TaxID=673318 RepID=A0ABS2QC86_9BACI|nr:hypothetical protein [Peribacillus deserti]MBM7690766.1 hypothetical protein [Peribacillus deserti]
MKRVLISLFSFIILVSGVAATSTHTKVIDDIRFETELPYEH